MRRRNGRSPRCRQLSARLHAVLLLLPLPLRVQIIRRARPLISRRHDAPFVPELIAPLAADTGRARKLRLFGRPLSRMRRSSGPEMSTLPSVRWRSRPDDHWPVRGRDHAVRPTVCRRRITYDMGGRSSVANGKKNSRITRRNRCGANSFGNYESACTRARNLPLPPPPFADRQYCKPRRNIVLYLQNVYFSMAVAFLPWSIGCCSTPDFPLAAPVLRGTQVLTTMNNIIIRQLHLLL